MKAILLFALSAIILSQSYGVAHAVHVSAHLGLDLEIEPPITVATDSSSYETGDLINISGSISDYDESDPYQIYDVTIRLIAPNNNIINISQVSPNSDGSYSTFILAQGSLWKFDGDYTISVSWGSDTNASTTFTFISEPEEVTEEEVTGEEVVEISEEELAEGCGPGTHLEDGICVLDETTVEPAPVSTGSVPTVGSTSLFYSITFTVLIAFAIMIVLYLISRGSRTKTA
jgi:hypothetical protein